VDAYSTPHTPGMGAKLIMVDGEGGWEIKVHSLRQIMEAWINT